METFGTLLKHQGISSYSLQPEMIADSGLSLSLMPGVEHLPYESLAELWHTLENKLSERTADQRYYFAYWPNLDGVQHTYGPQHPFVAQEYFGFLRELVHFLERARQRGKGDTLLLLTADHGMLATELSPEVEIRRYPELLSMMHLLPTGEARMPYLYLKPGFEQKALDLIESIFPGQFIPIDSQKALDAGLFGPPPYHPQAISRLGDVVLLARGNHYLYWQNKESTMHGRHGGLSSTEMLVPLLAFPL
ncbi:hypothetical protein EG834_11410 [bacterium]|nr:hypothetical protein [bacterium]